MTIDFHDAKNRNTYASREADYSWVQFIEERVPIKGKIVLDLECDGNKC